jgi:hypothetical protein
VWIRGVRQRCRLINQQGRSTHTHRSEQVSRRGGRRVGVGRGLLHALVLVEAIEGREPRIAHMGVVRDMPEATLMRTDDHPHAQSGCAP